MARQHVLMARTAYEDAKQEHQSAQAAMQLYMREQMIRQQYPAKPSRDRQGA